VFRDSFPRDEGGPGACVRAQTKSGRVRNVNARARPTELRTARRERGDRFGMTGFARRYARDRRQTDSRAQVARGRASQRGSGTARGHVVVWALCKLREALTLGPIWISLAPPGRSSPGMLLRVTGCALRPSRWFANAGAHQKDTADPLRREDDDDHARGGHRAGTHERKDLVL
jgi:hypothetical protein